VARNLKWTDHDPVESRIVDKPLRDLERLFVISGKWNRNSCRLAIRLIGERRSRYAVEGPHNSRTW
jgi:hypothetical protein